MAADNNDFTHEFQIYSTDLNAGTMGTGKFLLFDNNINAVKVENIDNIKIGGGEEGQVLITDGEGNLTWATSSGGGGVAVNADWNSSSGASRILNKPDLTAYLPKSGGTLTGKLNAAQGAGTTGGYSFGGTEGANDTGMFSNADGILDFYADNIKIVTVTTGGVTSTQAITLPGNPTSNLQAATKQYVDSSVSALNNFSGNYNDLTNKPTVATSAYIGTTQVAFDRASGSLTLTGVSIDGNAATVSNGVYTNGSYSNPAWITSLAYSKLTDAPSLADVATSGSYTDLADKPTLATVATSGSYTDLTNRPSIFSGSYADLTNKPTLFDGAYLSLTGLPNLAAVATSGDYNDLANKPSIPAAQVNADWNETISESPAYILNKPTIPDLTGYATEAWVNSQGFGSGSGGTSYNQSLNTTDDVTFNTATITSAAGIENADGQRITNTYYNGTMLVGSNLTQTPVSILMGGAGPRNEWKFTPDGNLTLPRNADQVTTTDPIVRITGGANPQISSTNSDETGPADFGIQANTLNISGYNGNKVSVHADDGSITSDGNLVLASNSQGPTYSVTVGSDGVISMNTARGSIEFGAQPEEGAPQHLHIMRPAGQEGSTDLYFGDDYNYVKMPSSSYSQQGVEIGSSLNQGTVHTWRFGTDGDLILPNDGDILRYNGEGYSSVLGGGSGNGLDPYVTIVDDKVTVTADIDFPASDVAGVIATVGGNFNFGVYFQETTGDADGNMYAAGKSYEDSSYAIVYAFNPNGSVRWKTNLTISGNTQAPDLHNIKLKGDYVYVGFTYYDNNAGSEYHGVAKLVAETGALNYDWIIETPQNTYPQIYDIAINNNGEPIMVGTYGNSLTTLSNVPTQAGGGINSVIFNNSDLQGYTSQSGWGGQWQVETAPGVFSYPDYINTAYVPVTNVTNPSATGMIAAFRYDQNQPSYWGGVIINDPGTYNVGDQLKVPGSLLFGIDGDTSLTPTYNSFNFNTDGGHLAVLFDATTYPDLYNQLNACTWAADVNGGGTYSILSVSPPSGGIVQVDIDTVSSPITSSVIFYTQNGNDATWSFNGGQLNGLAGTPSPELKAKTWFSWNSPGPNGSETDFTSSTNVNLKAYLGNQAMIWTPSWNYTYGTSDSEYFYGVAYDSANDKIYVAGEFWGQVNGTYHEGTLFKINGSDGTVEWSKYVEDNTGASDTLRSVLVDSDGNVITVGENNNGYTLVTKLNSYGEIMWQARQTNTNNWDNEARGAIDSDGNVYVTGVLEGDNDYVSIMKLNGNDGSLNWARTFNNIEGYNFNEFDDEDSQTTNVAGTNLYYGGLSYDANDDEYIAVALRLPIDGTNTGTYGRWIYAEDTNAEWEDCTGSANLYTATFPAVAFDGQNLVGERTYSNIDSVGNPTATAITLGGSGHNITNVGGITFADGTTQTTAAVSNPPITWTNGNGNTWRIETYNGGYNGTYNGDDYDAKWFDVNDAPGGDNNFRGAIIEYHAYFSGQGTMVGTIHISRDNDSGDYATHTEHMSGDSNMQKMSVWFTNGNDKRLYFKRTDGNTQDIMIQWTAKIFYGSEYYC